MIGTDEFLLSNATELMLDDVPSLVTSHHGICFPAHVDREANGILATLGSFPETPRFSVAEFHDAAKVEAYREKYSDLYGMRIVIGSDAHYLWDIRDRDDYFDLADEPYSTDYVRSQLFRLLGGRNE